EIFGIHGLELGIWSWESGIALRLRRDRVRGERTMHSGISISVSPIVPWPILTGTILAVTVLTLLAYRRRLRGTWGTWRGVAFSVRLLALLLCLMAALRPSVLFKEKKRQAASLVFLVDT